MSLEIENSQGEYCTDFVWGDHEGDGISLCRCPHCNGFLSSDFPITEGEQWQCKKCSAVLEVIITGNQEEEEYYYEVFNKGILYQLGLEPIPPFDATEGEYFEGKICVVPPKLVKIPTQDFAALRKERGPRRKNTHRKVFMGKVLRTVWRDTKGEYIEIGDMRISADDPRLTKVKELLK